MGMFFFFRFLLFVSPFLAVGAADYIGHLAMARPCRCLPGILTTDPASWAWEARVSSSSRSDQESTSVLRRFCSPRSRGC
ncbi:hypothetical protein V8C34DRAFT_278900 [Trichoderma compactum]